MNRVYKDFPPDYIFRNHAFNMANDYEKKKIANVIITCSYEDIFGKCYYETFDLNLIDGFGSTKMTPPASYIGLISHEIKNLNKIVAETNSKLNKLILKNKDDSSL